MFQNNRDFVTKKKGKLSATTSPSQFGCKDILGEAGANRDLAIALLLPAGQSGEFEIQAPQEKTQDAMKAKA
jgi:hypothetical protein